MRPWECRQTHILTDANRFYNLSHAICYSYGTDKNTKITTAYRDSWMSQCVEWRGWGFPVRNIPVISTTRCLSVSHLLCKTMYVCCSAGENFRVYVLMPLLPAFEGEIGTNTGNAIQAVVHWNYSSICRGGKSLLERLVLSGGLYLCVCVCVSELLYWRAEW